MWKVNDMSGKTGVFFVLAAIYFHHSVPLLLFVSALSNTSDYARRIIDQFLLYIIMDKGRPYFCAVRVNTSIWGVY